jgi:hypothetical protein
MADSMTVLRNAGPPGTKRNIVVLGDGFQAGADQTTYNDWVDSTLIKGVFGHDYYSEDASASISTGSISSLSIPGSARGPTTNTALLMIPPMTRSHRRWSTTPRWA